MQYQGEHALQGTQAVRSREAAEAAMVDISLTPPDDTTGGEELSLQGKQWAQFSSTDECRICRSSAQELLEGEAASRGHGDGCCCCWARRPPQPPLRRLRCACAGSVRYVCARCYSRYYVARGLAECEICRQPTGLEGEEPERADGPFCRRRLASFCCSDEVRYFAYALFILVAFVTAFGLFFVFSAAADQAAGSETKAGGHAAKDHPDSVTPQPEVARRTERLVFAGIALVNLAFAVAYIAYSYWRYQRGETSHSCCCCCCRCCRSCRNCRQEQRSVELLAHVGTVAVTTRQQEQQPQAQTHFAMIGVPPF